LTIADSSQLPETSVRRFLTVVEATASSIPSTGVPHLGPILVEKLNSLVQYLQPDPSSSLKHESSSVSAASPQPSPSQSFKEVHLWLIVLIRLTVIHREMFSQAKPGSWDQARLLVALCALLQNERIQVHDGLYTYIADVASYFVDDLSEEQRSSIRRFLTDKPAKPLSPFIRYLFGFHLGPTDWLWATQRGKVVPFPVKRWEILNEPTPNVGENDTSLSLTLFHARKAQGGRKSGVGAGRAGVGV
jgi:mediator of RNA polymerase II transcription subunit 12, fungi type